MKSLYLLCGPAGAGKSTWVKNQNSSTLGKTIHISRDAIRFNMLKDDEDYFAHENEVFDEFIDVINNQILYADVDTIFVDATHLNQKSRNKTLDRLFLDNVNLYAVNVNPTLGVCLAQNEKREGRAYVPPTVIARMWDTYTPPAKNEKYHYKRIINVNDWRDSK